MNPIETLRQVVCNSYVEENMRAAFVKNIPNLRGHVVCDFLANLDKEEEDAQEEYKSTTRAVGLAVGGIATSVGALTSLTVISKGGDSVSAAVGGLSIALLAWPFIAILARKWSTEDAAYRQEQQPYSDLNKILHRITAKIERIKCRQLSAVQHTHAESIQLEISRKFFESELKILSQLLELPYGTLTLEAFIINPNASPSNPCYIPRGYAGPKSALALSDL